MNRFSPSISPVKVLRAGQPWPTRAAQQWCEAGPHASAIVHIGRWGQKGSMPEPRTNSNLTYTECFTISEWILATPLTAWEPITHRWAILIRLQSPSSITDILRRRSTSPGNRAATCCCQDREALAGGLTMF